MLQKQTLGTKKASWQRAIARAVERDYENAIRFLGTAHFPDGRSESLFVVSSGSTHGRKYAVRIFGIPGEGAKLACDCEAGQRGQWFCWHEAAAALMFGLVLPPADNDKDGAA